MSIDAMKQALEALIDDRMVEVEPDSWELRSDLAIAALRAAIEQAEKQEPVAWKWKERVNNEFDSWVITASEPPPYAIETHPLYTAPRQWQGLTEEEIFKVENAVPDEVIGDSNWCVYFAKAIEAKLKEKNT